LPPRRASPTHGSPTSSPRYENLLIMKQIFVLTLVGIRNMTATLLQIVLWWKK
jgi:hypothetical protein